MCVILCKSSVLMHVYVFLSLIHLSCIIPSPALQIPLAVAAMGYILGQLASFIVGKHFENMLRCY